jgi:hypothetical protein
MAKCVSIGVRAGTRAPCTLHRCSKRYSVANWILRLSKQRALLLGSHDIDEDLHYSG